MTESLIFGVGDEVLFLLVLFVTLLVSGWFILYTWICIPQFLTRLGGMFADQNFDPPRANSQDLQVPDRGSTEDTCPICLSGFVFKVETNCGHTFCGPCMRRYLQHEDFVIQTMTCPLCRQPITLLFNSYTEEERNALPETEIGNQRVEMNILINRFNRIAAGTPKTLLQNIHDWPVLIRRLFNELFSRQPMLLFRLRVILLISCGVLYVLSPIDALPEAVYGILGFVDDILVILFCIWYIVNVYRSFLANREGDFDD